MSMVNVQLTILIESWHRLLKRRMVSYCINVSKWTCIYSCKGRLLDQRQGCYFSLLPTTYTSESTKKILSMRLLTVKTTNKDTILYKCKSEQIDNIFDSNLVTLWLHRSWPYKPSASSRSLLSLWIISGSIDTRYEGTKPTYNCMHFVGKGSKSGWVRWVHRWQPRNNWRLGRWSEWNGYC